MPKLVLSSTSMEVIYTNDKIFLTFYSSLMFNLSDLDLYHCQGFNNWKRRCTTSRINTRQFNESSDEPQQRTFMGPYICARVAVRNQAWIRLRLRESDPRFRIDHTAQRRRGYSRLSAYLPHDTEITTRMISLISLFSRTTRDRRILTHVVPLPFVVFRVEMGKNNGRRNTKRWRGRARLVWRKHESNQ